MDLLAVFLNRDKVKAVLGTWANVAWEECSGTVSRDVMKSVWPHVEALLRKTSATRGFGISASASCPRKHGSGTCPVMWWVNAGAGGEEELADYVQRSSTLSHAVVFRAGHLVPADNGLDAQARGIF
ncbi:hypothetical protein QOZ80_6BG0470340 [Eleusine coracana subsp. coracana]|nr:hypothetical protein QOZ80_6BG0470340 [Eleusine coracana subsp. coracana]